MATFNDLLYAAVKIDVEFSDGQKSKTARGTGFVIADDENNTYFITNRHLVDINYKFKDGSYKNYELVKFDVTFKSVDDNKLPNNTRVLSFLSVMLEYPDDINEDVAVMTSMAIKTSSDNINMFYNHFTVNILATKEDFQTNLWAGDSLLIAGYPEWYDELGIRPIYRTGIIASDPRFEYSYKNVSGRCVAYEGFSSEGTSGGPILVIPRSVYPVGSVRVVGINAGHFISYPSMGHSGISYFFKSIIILELIESLKKNKF